MSDEKKPTRTWDVYNNDVTNNNAPPLVNASDDMIKQIMSRGAGNMVGLLFNKMLDDKLNHVKDTSGGAEVVNEDDTEEEDNEDV